MSHPPASGRAAATAVAAAAPAHAGVFLGHPAGLFVLFLVEMWERFSYYGMRGLLVLYLTSPTSGMRVRPPGAPEGFNPGRGWSDELGNTAYGWYSGLAYLTPIIGGLIADKFIGTHRSMLVGAILITMGHVVLGLSGIGELAQSPLGMSVFVLGLALIVIGTGHFKPTVSVMVGQLYEQHDPRRETAFGIFYMGINLGAALQTYIVGTLGERLGWHYGFSAAAVGMLAGLALYISLRPVFLAGVGLPPPGRGRNAVLFIPLGMILAVLVAAAFHVGWLGKVDVFFSQKWVVALLALAGVSWATYITWIQKPEDRGPVASIFIFMLFNAVFWLSFEQAGSSINIFTDRDTNRTIALPAWFGRMGVEPGFPLPWVLWALLGVAVCVLGAWMLVRNHRSGRHPRAVAGLLLALLGIGLTVLGVLKALGYLKGLAEFTLIPTTWFQSVNPWLIIIFAPITGVMWTALSRRNANPPQPAKIGMGLLLVGLGYLFMVWAALQARDGAKAAMWLIFGTYFVHTMGEIILSPTGLSYVTKAAPRQYLSLLMGVWFISSFIANLGAGKVAAQVEKIVAGEVRLPWHIAGDPAGPNSQADFFFLFTVTSCAAGIVILVLTPWLKRLTGGRE